MIRVAHIALQLETGGLERLLIEHARHARREEFELRFIGLGKRGPVADEIEALGWPVTTLGAPPGLRPSLILQLARALKSHGVDVVHTHNTKPLLYGGPAARLAGLPKVIHTRHGQRHGATRVHDAMFGLASRCAHRMVCVSQDAAGRCRDEGVAADLIATIHNGVDTQRFPFRGPASDGPALYVGRLSPEKDLETLLKAAATVSRRFPSFRLVIAGEGPCKARLESFAGELALREHVRFLGSVSDVPALLSTAGAFVLSSLSEGLPVTVLEAMATGLPVIATAVGGTPEAVEHGVTGLLAASGDDAALASALERVMSHPGMAREMGTAGRRRVEARFSSSVMVRQYEALYREVAPRELKGMAA
jgi:glycosyltransferase involved in cell wall biosynthesis